MPLINQKQLPKKLEVVEENINGAPEVESDLPEIHNIRNQTMVNSFSQQEKNDIVTSPTTNRAVTQCIG